MASQWMIDRVKGTSTQGSPPTLPTPTLNKTSPKPVVQPLQKPSYNPLETFKTNVDTGVRKATAGLGMVGRAINAPQQLVQDKITGGKGYEDFYTNNPVGKTIVKGASSKVVQGILPPAAAFSTPKRASFASEMALDPLNLVGAGVVSKVGKATGVSKLATKVLPVVKKIPGYQKARDAVGALEYGYGLQPKFLKKLESTKTEISKAGEYAAKVATPLKYGPDGKELPKVTQTILGDVMRIMQEGSSRALTQDELVTLKKYEPVVKKVFDEFDRLAKAQVKAGVNPETFSQFKGKYGGKRIFSQTFTEPKVSGGGVKLDTSPYIKRKNLSDETRKTLGEIKEPAYGAAVSAFAEKKNLEVMKLFKSVAKNDAISTQGFDALEAGEKAKYVLIPKESKYGVLAGSYVPKQVSNYIKPLVEKGPTGVAKAMESFTKVWKPIKTVGSPAQLGRNIVTSQVQNFLENPMSLAYLPQAIKERMTKGKFYKALKDTGEIAQSSPSIELGNFKPPELNKFTKGNLVSKAFELFKKPGSAIQNNNEIIAKTQSFIARLTDEAGKAGVTIDEALKNKKLVELARQSSEASGFNYQKVSPLVNKLRKGPVPFITYPLKAGKLTAKTLAKNPERINALRKTEQAVQDVTDKEKPDEQYLPDYLKQAVRVGKPNEKGATPYLNTKYVYPWGNMSDIASG